MEHSRSQMVAGTFLAVMVSAMGTRAGAQSPASQQPSIRAECQPVDGVAPLMIHVTAVAKLGALTYICAKVEIPDGGSYFSCSWPELTADLDFDHELTCPGTYLLHACATITSECTAPSPNEAYLYREWTVTVAAPSFTLLPQGVELGEVRLITSDDIRFDRIAETVVTWGDGTPTEPISWEPVLGGYATPVHAYAGEGAYTATVTNRYLGARCSFDQESSVTVDVGAPNPIEPASWGAVKSLYR